ncbi:head-tail adaptor protein [Paracoccus albus]|uniref:head-tail adaptor protein n=1 Tax=Paracoccus albus TaxID=3017784 RepID=UPI0022F01992|nr:head-tail adaptor protein [Paracoccus albus]WBU61815.1 head-tail adaptor protein [Paracoccus albus]
MNVPLTLEQKHREADGMGGYRTVWRSLGLLYASMKSGSGRLSGGEVGPESVSRWQIRLRAFPLGDPRRPVAGQRLRMGQRIFHVEAVAEADVAGRYLRVSAREDER